MKPARSVRRSARGLTILEMSIVLAILACAFVAILDVLHVLGMGMKDQTVRSDLVTRTQGTLDDMVAELHQAASYSPHFSIEQNPSAPPRITFDMVQGIDNSGNIVWGNVVTYRLVNVSATQGAEFAYLNVVPGQILRDESGPTTPLSTTIAEDLVPYQFVQDGVTHWGFSVSRSGSALTLAISRFGSPGVTAGNAAAAPTILTTRGVYFLRNSQNITTLK
jgi:hypothetical protein